jgi:hypothetical protein
MNRRAVPAWRVGCGRKGPTVEKRQRNGLECNTGIRNRGLRRQLRRGSREIFYEVLGQAIGQEVMKRTVWSSVRIRKTSVKTLVEEPATAQGKGETTSSLGAIDVGASTALGTFACTDRSKMGVIHMDWFTPYQGATRDERP